MKTDIEKLWSHLDWMYELVKTSADNLRGEVPERSAAYDVTVRHLADIYRDMGRQLPKIRRDLEG